MRNWLKILNGKNKRASKFLNLKNLNKMKKFLRKAKSSKRKNKMRNNNKIKFLTFLLMYSLCSKVLMY